MSNADLEWINSLNEGIRGTVRWLTENGFKTTDSGDGQTRDYECDQDKPYVHMLAIPEYLVEETDRLVALLALRGIKVHAWDGECNVPCVESHYDPIDGFAVITLWNVKL